MEAGQRIGGRFVVQKRAGAGGMAAVYRALDEQTQTEVALKVLHGQHAEHEGRFLREAEILASIVHPGVVGYVAHGSDENGPWLAMRWIDGQTIGERLRAHGAMPLGDALDLGIAVCEALGAAHALGVIHRDLKPGNLMIPRGKPASRVLVLDFGIARLLDALGPMTEAGALVGTPGYASPEQARAAPTIDGRADLFSLGCVLFACLTGKPPFRGDDVLAVLAKIVFQATPRVRDEVPQIHPEVDRVLARMMAKAPDERYATADAAKEALVTARVSALAERPPAPLSSSTGISLREARLCSIVLVSGIVSANAARDARAIAAAEGGDAEGFASGGLAVRFVASASAAERVLVAARCALRLRDRFPGAAVSLATVREGTGRTELIADAIDRAAALARGGLSRRPHAQAPVKIDEVSAGLVEARFDVSRVDGELALVRELEGPNESRRLRGNTTPCVGRERELALLDGTLAQVIDEGVSRAVLVVADAGMGKSRLQVEWLRRVRARGDGIQVWHGRCDPLGGSSLIGRIVRRIAEMHDDEPPALKHAKLRARLSAVVAPAQIDRVHTFVAELAAIGAVEGPLLQAARTDPILMGDHLRRAFEDWVEAECRVRPLLIVLEDLHWADPTAVRLVDGALARASELPLLVLALARPTIRAAAPRLWAERRLQELPLEELSRKSAERLARAVLGDGHPQASLDRIVALANGNPFFLEELLLQVGDGKSSDLPETVLALVESRLLRLPAEARRILRAASVYGQTFWRSGVRALVEIDGDELDRWLDKLIELDAIVRVRDGRFVDQPEFTFRHAIVRDASYVMLPPEEKTSGHRSAAAWLESMGEPDPGVLAEHYERCGERNRTPELYWRSAQRMLEGSELPVAIAIAHRGLLANPAPSTRSALLAVLMDAHRWSGNLEGCLECSLEVLRLEVPCTDRWALALHAAATSCFKLGRSDELRALMNTGRAVLTQGAPTPGLASMAASLAITATLAGDSGTASFLHNVLRDSGAREHPHARAMVHSFEAFFADTQGNLQGQIEHFEAAGNAYAAIGHRRGWAMAMANAAYACTLIGDFERADGLLSRALPVALEMRNAMVVASIHVDHALVLERLGRFGQARAVAEVAIAEQSAQGDHRMEAAARLTLALALVREGRIDEGIAAARLGVDRMRAAPRNLGYALAILAHALLEGGTAPEALEVVREAAAFDAKNVGSAAGSVLLRLVHARALAANERSDEARVVLESAHAEVLRQAGKLHGEDSRRRFRERVWENAQTLAWAEELGIGA